MHVKSHICEKIEESCSLLKGQHCLFETLFSKSFSKRVFSGLYMSLPLDQSTYRFLIEPESERRVFEPNIFCLKHIYRLIFRVWSICLVGKDTLYKLFSFSRDLKDIDGINSWIPLSIDIPTNRTEILHNIDDIYGNAALTVDDYKILKGKERNVCIPI